MSTSAHLIDLRAWRQFVAVAEELHFGRAAQRLHLTQPPVTKAIAQLEDALGVQLFDRTRRRVALTPAGAALLPEARELLARAQALPRLARAAAAGEVGRVRLAFVSTIGFDQLPRWVRGFRALCPDVMLELVEATGDVQLQALARGDIDAGLVLHSPGAAPPALAHLRVAREPLVLALPQAHPLARLAPLPLARVLAEPLVTFARAHVPSLHDAIGAMYRAAGLEPQVAQEAIQMQTIVNLVAGGMGVAWVPQSVTQFRRAGVVYRSGDQLAGATARRKPALPLAETSLVWPTSASQPALERFVAFVRSQLGS